MVYGKLVIVPIKMLSFYLKSIDWRQKFRPVSEFYKSDLPCYRALEAELDDNSCDLNDTSCHPGNISSTLKSTHFKSFSNVKVCQRILGTWPVTTCSCERSFSSMRMLEFYTRSKMISERLNGIKLMPVHQEIVLDIEKVINLFSIINRRLNFIWFLLVSNQYVTFALKIIFSSITCIYISDIYED